MTQRGRLTEPGSKATASKAEDIIWRLVLGFTRLSPSDPLQASVSGIPIPTPHPPPLVFYYLCHPLQLLLSWKK